MDNIKSNICLRCGRKLKNPESILRGYGDICYEKHIRELKRKSLFEKDTCLQFVYK